MTATIDNIPVDQIAELYGDEPRILSSHIQDAGGHPLHVEGGAELAWKLVADLHLLHQRLTDTIEKLRGAPCAHCGKERA